MRTQPGTAILYSHVMEIFFHHKASPFVRKVLLGIIELSVDTVDRASDFSSTEAMKEYE